MYGPQQCAWIEIVSALSFAIGLRAIVSLHPYSGAGKPPLFGDYEAQRHWQEVTWNIPAKQWYKNTTQNDLLYWGLDYPPLTAYHSLAIAGIGGRLNESYIALETSRGYESSEHKSFMRSTVLFADMFLYIPALILLGWTLTQLFKGKRFPLTMFLIIMLTYPGQVLIDNGHFQYNNISLGLAAVAIACLAKDQWNLSALCFTLALNYKQMELYHALPFFFYLLRKCADQDNILKKIGQLLKLALVVLGTTAVIWLPWLTATEDLKSLLERLFPFNRGIFEDKVSNVWCAINTLYKMKEKISNERMALLSLSVTLSVVAPLNVQLFAKKHMASFLRCLTNTALAFFLFSFQVHEKSILLVALPAMCLVMLSETRLSLMIWFLEVTTFSMWPLLQKDGLAYAYFASMLIFYGVSNVYHQQEVRWITILRCLSEVGMVLLSVALLAAPAPLRYPDLWPLLISIYSCVHFVLFLVYKVYFQLTGNEM